jgi:hypothetical protein
MPHSFSCCTCNMKPSVSVYERDFNCGIPPRSVLSLTKHTQILLTHSLLSGDVQTSSSRLYISPGIVHPYPYLHIVSSGETPQAQPAEKRKR